MVSRVKVKRRNLPPWGPLTMLVCGRINNGKIAAWAMILPSGSEYHVAAFTGPLHPNSMEEVFDDHSHKVVGVFKTIAKAKQAGEKHLNDWRKQGLKHKKCKCPETK